jgi:hypothetical protein
VKPVRTTLAADSVWELEVAFPSPGFAMLKPPTRRASGGTMLVTDPEGSVFEFLQTMFSGL